MEKNIIVTGGAQGIGKIVSKELLKNGYSVSVFEIDNEANKEFQNEINSEKIAFFQTDVADERSVQKSIQASTKKFGNISGLINNAAIHANKPISELSFEEWNRVISVNLSGSFLCSKYAAPFLKKNKRKYNKYVLNPCFSVRTKYRSIFSQQRRYFFAYALTCCEFGT